MTRQNLRVFRSKDRTDLLDERQIIRICLEGDTKAFECLVDKYRDRVFAIAYHLVLDSEDARDVTQQTFLNLWRSLSHYNVDRPLANWVSRIAANCAIDFLRNRKPVEPIQDIAMERFPLDRVLDIRKIFFRIAPLLPERQRIALVLREVNGMEITEISELLHCTESTVRNLLSQAKDSFRKKTKELFPEYGM